MRNTIIGLACASCLTFGAFACDRQASRETAQQPEPPESHAALDEGDEPTTLDVDLETAEGTELEGTAELKETESGVQIALSVEDAPPGKHGVHIHERGDCSDIPGASMGAHYAPNAPPHAEQHGLPQEGTHHIGDLGNIEVGSDGKGQLSVIVPQASLKPGSERTFLGKAIVVHATEDKGSAAGPSGGSGTPIACGVIDD